MLRGPAQSSWAKPTASGVSQGQRRELPPSLPACGVGRRELLSASLLCSLGDQLTSRARAIEVEVEDGNMLMAPPAGAHSAQQPGEGVDAGDQEVSTESCCQCYESCVPVRKCAQITVCFLKVTKTFSCFCYRTPYLQSQLQRHPKAGGVRQWVVQRLAGAGSS
jgi:hypothetical protein